MTGRPNPFPTPRLAVEERVARRWIIALSGVVFVAVVLLNRVSLPAPAGIDPHLFARINAVLNSVVSLLLVLGLLTARLHRWEVHRRLMTGAIALSVLFLASYILHHLFAGDTPFGGTGWVAVVYYVILFSHILLAALSLPFILFTAYRALSAQYPAHRRLARRVWPVWFYVSVTGVIIYLMISPYYGARKAYAPSGPAAAERLEQPG